MHLLIQSETESSASAHLTPCRANAAYSRQLSVSVRCVAILASAFLLGACTRASIPKRKVEGDQQQGAYLIGEYGCGTCHTIPGIANADGQIGPPLNSIAQRVYIAGKLRNTPDNMIRWLKNPQAVAPGNVMPDMGLSSSQARDITAYLYTLDQ